jgi:exodeoxyribonuclease VII large subunit
MEQKNKTLTVSEFCQFVKEILPTKKFQVSGEINQLKNSHGHIFFTFKDNDSCLNATIWKSKADTIKNSLKEGDKITVEGKLDYYSSGGKLNFIIDKLLTNDGIGDLIKKYQLTKDSFEKKGYFDSQKKLKLKPVIKNILLLTSESGAAYQDFLYGIENGNIKINIDLIDVIVQGNDCAKNISDQLENIKNSDKNYDLVILTRGGGSFQDLFGFSQPELIESIYNFNLPTLSAIGHQVDNPLSDLVCDYSAPTPSLAAQFIVDYNKNYFNKFDRILKELSNQINLELLSNLEKINLMMDKINKKWISFENGELKQNLLNELNYLLRKLDSYESKLDMYHTSNILLNSNGKILKSSDELSTLKNKNLEIIWNGVILKVKIESINSI